MNEADIHAVLQEELSNIAPEANLREIDSAADLREALDIDSMDFSTSSLPCIIAFASTFQNSIIPSSLRSPEQSAISRRSLQRSRAKLGRKHDRDGLLGGAWIRSTGYSAGSARRGALIQPMTRSACDLRLLTR